MTIQQIVEITIYAMLAIGLVIPLFLCICVATWGALIRSIKESRDGNTDQTTWSEIEDEYRYK